MSRFSAGAAAALVFVFVSSAFSQTVTGTITGTVVDATGAAAPNVAITATQTNTNLKFRTQTTDAGVYTLGFLPVGEYHITAEASGFKTATLGPFQLDVNQTVREDIRLEVGQVSERVEVSATSAILQTENAQTGDIISGKEATELPLNGRNFVSLTLLVPGSISPNPNQISTASRNLTNGRPYVNGNREQTNNFLLDGIDINEPVGDYVAYNPNVDALQEVQVLTGNSNAEFGNGNGAVVNMATKSGTNEFHGNVFEFLENDKLDANSFFNNRSGAKKQALRQNQFGGTLGGPIRKDRLFFFVDYQGTRVANNGQSPVTVVPASLRAGDLSVYPQTIKDPTTGSPFPGNIIPASRIVNPIAKALFSNPTLYPLPNANGSGPLRFTNDFVGTLASSVQNDQADAKIDYRPSDRDNINGRFTIDRFNQNNPSHPVLPTQLGQLTDAPTTGGVINWTHTLSPTTVNEARIGFTRVKIQTATTDPRGVLGKNGDQTLGIPGSQPIAGASNVTLSTDFTAVGSVASDRITLDDDYHYSDNFTKLVGRHSLKMGFNFIRYQENNYYAGNNGLLGTFVYDGTYTGNAYADFLLDELHTKGRGSQTGLWGHRQWRDGIFFQDDFKVRQNLTLNLGLRWEYTQPLYEVADRQTNVNLQTGQAELAGKNGASRGLYSSYYKQFMPRVGFAYTPAMFRNKLVVRGGYGITSFLEGTGANLRLTLNPPFYFESAITYDANAPGHATVGFTDVQPLNTLSGQVRAWNPNLRPAFIQQWNLTTQYLFSNDFSVTAAYVGQNGTHLVNPIEYNQPLPGVGPVSTWLPLQQRRPLNAVAPLITNISGTDSSAIMRYNSLQVSANKRLSRGLQFVANYTISRTLTDNIGYYGSTGVAAAGAYWQNAYDRHGDYGPAFFDALHNFSFGSTWDIPVGVGRHFGSGLNRIADAFVGGWKLDGIVSAHSGFPVTLNAQDVSNQAVRGGTRPNRYKPLNFSGQSIDHWFGTGNTFCLTPGVNDGNCVYGVPATGTFGNSGISTARAPGFKNLDLSLGKKFTVHEKQYFDFHADFFNVANHANFGPPGINISNPATFGAITTQIGLPRVIQLGLKYYF
jgi:hypothetical protein